MSGTSSTRLRLLARNRRSKNIHLRSTMGFHVECLALTKAHRSVEGEHRQAAWRVMLNHVPDGDRGAVVQAMSQAVNAWLAYREDVAEACGIRRDELPLTA